MTNFERTKAWLIACGKEQTSENMSVRLAYTSKSFVSCLLAYAQTPKATPS